MAPCESHGRRAVFPAAAWRAYAFPACGSRLLNRAGLPGPVSRVLPSPGPQQAVPGTPAFPLEWRFFGVGAECLRLRPPGGFVDASRPAPVRGCEYRSPASCRVTSESRRVRHGPARVRPSGWAGLERERAAAERETATSSPAHSLNPAPRAHPRASKSSSACPIASRLRWHSKISSLRTRFPASKSACLIPSA